MNGRVIVIGGGIAGLCAAVYAQQCGYQAVVLEMSPSVGGLATSWRRNGYTFENCLHWLTGCNPELPLYPRWREVFDIGKLTFVYPQEFARLEAQGKDSLSIYTNPDRLREELMSKAPEDAREIARLVSAIRRFSHISIPDPAAGRLARVRDALRLLPDLPSLWHWSHLTSEEYGRRFKHSLLRRLFGEGEMAQLSAVAIAFALAWMSQREAAYVVGGSKAIIQLIEENLRHLGGELRCNARVQEILVESGRAVGVRLADGEPVLADWVISAADGHATRFELLGGRYLDAQTRRLYEDAKVFPSYVQVGIGLARDLSGYPAYLTKILDKPLQLDPLTVLPQASFRFFHFDPTFAPRGKTAVTCFLPTRHDQYWVDLQRASPEVYGRQKSRIANEVVGILEHIVPGAGAAVEVVDVSTPATVIRFTGNWRGSMEGWLLTPGRGYRPLPNTVPGLERFLMVGQWVLPGGGLPSGLLTARAAVATICEKDRVPFRPGQGLAQDAHARRPLAAIDPPGRPI